MIAGPFSAVKQPIMSLAFLLFAMGIFFSISAVNLYVGPVPVRALWIVAPLALILAAFPKTVKQVLLSQQKLVVIIAICAAIGLMVSILNQASVVPVFTQIVEIHVQALICLILAAFFIQYFGIRYMAILFLSIWSISAMFAIGQATGIDFAWQARAHLGDWMNDPAITRAFYDEKSRAVGLSFTPVHLATQTCLAFAVFFALRLHETGGKAIAKIDWPLLGGWVFAVTICVISGNRSPLIGLLGVLVIYLWFVIPKLRPVLIPVLFLALLALPILQELGRELGFRIARTEDGSAVGRSTLWSFGLFLFGEQPAGYGLLFDSSAHAAKFAHRAIHLENPDIIRHFSLHNYYLLMLNKYGLLIVFIIPWILPRNKLQLTGWLAFLPYLIHITFHNDGPLSSDFLIWFLIPIFSVLEFRLPDTSKDEPRNHLREVPAMSQ